MEERAHQARASREGEDEARRSAGTMSGGRTAPSVIAKMRAATLGEAPRARNRSLRTVSAEIAPILSAISASETSSRRIQALSETMGSVPPARLAEALAVLVVDLVGVLPVADRRAALERLANRLDGRGRMPGGSEAAVLLGAVGAALIRIGA